MLVCVLRKDQDVRIRTDISADVAKRGARHVATGHPQIYLGDGAAACDDAVRDPDLAIELERARLDGNGTRGRRRLGKLIDDSQAHPQPCEPQRQHQARRSCPDDEDVGLTNQ